ncbi:hypothetical protein [Brucella tritici]|uniref:hypothetical protein n=2 Tax=Brucella TaxID=234 RepID=UPI0020009A93|nr:hypothetical protein [Brucella tritici]
MALRAEQTQFATRAVDANQNTVFAPALNALPRGAPLVLATLPILDWNSDLMEAVKHLDGPVRPNCYAAVMMIDPFTLWEDLGDLLLERGFAGVINFPPASLLEVKQSHISTDLGNIIEVDRMKWFHDVGFKLVYTATEPGELKNIQLRLSGLLDAIVNVPTTTLELPISDDMPLDRDLMLKHDREGAPPILAFRRTK